MASGRKPKADAVSNQPTLLRVIPSGRFLPAMAPMPSRPSTRQPLPFQAGRPKRIFVHVDIVEPFINELSKRVSALKAGSGFDPGVRIGPLMNDAALEKVDRQVRDAISNGAELIAGD